MSSLNQVEKHQYIFLFLQMEMDQFLIYGIAVKMVYHPVDTLHALSSTEMT